ncbi:MAG: bifunctional metallophosphatase/5'-nucleotidase, partial [Nocardioidaceae bacterium]
TTDLHGHVFNWNYFTDSEYDDGDHNDVGLAKISTLVGAVRADLGTNQTLLVDAGDTIQGTPLAYYYARIDPISDTTIHPMAAAMNAIGYDAAALGNHEFNYGIPLLRTFQDQLDFPLLGANAVDAHSGHPAFPPYTLHTVKLNHGPRLTIGILGLTNPGIAIWDKANVSGSMEFPGLVEQAAMWVPRIRRAGADVVVVSAHSGADGSSSYGDALPYVENGSTLVAEQVPGIDAILVGHAHVEIDERFVENEQTGEQVLLTEPLKWGMRLSLIDLDVELHRGRWRVVDRHSQVLNANTVDEDPDIVSLLTADHKDVVEYVNSPIGTSLQSMSAQTAIYEDTPAMDFVNYVQADAVKQELADTPEGELPLLAIAAPFNRQAEIPKGQVSVRDVAAMYIYDNTLLAVTMTGAQIRDYLEFSVEYFKQISGTGPFAPDDVTNAPTERAPSGTPDYNYDILGGLDAALTYDIDIAKAVGSRITNLAYDGSGVDDGAPFVVAVNNYRQSGGGGFPHVSSAPVVYNRQVEIRQLIIDWVSEHQVIDAADFASMDWRLVSDGKPITITP